MTDRLYRANIQAYADGNVQCRISTYYVIKRTKCGAWISYLSTPDPKDWKKFVNLEATKKWASPTIDEAIHSLLQRKRRQVAIVRAQLEHAARCLDALEKGIKPWQTINDGCNFALPDVL